MVNPDAVVYKENTADDPGRRKPDITKAKELLGWSGGAPGGGPQRWLGFPSEAQEEDEDGPAAKAKNW